MTDFFDFSIDPRSGNSLGMFSFGHILWLLAALAAWLMLCRSYKRCVPARRARIRCAVAGAALAMELLRSLLLMLAGEYGIGRLPLHLCALAIYISFLHALRGGELTGQFLYAFCMPGAVCALLFPDWRVYPLVSFLTFAGFAGHFLIVTYVVMQVLAGDIAPDIRRAGACLLLMLALAVPVFIFDRLTATNYMFLNYPSPGSPLEWFSFLGRPGYILGYVPLLAAVWAVIYAPFIKKRRAG